MKRLTLLVLAALLSLSGLAFAESNNIIRMNAPIGKGVSAKWVPAPPLYSNWADTQDSPSCTLWTPDAADIASGTAFLQTATDCQQNQERTVQPREKNSITGAYRNAGSLAFDHQVVTVSMTRTAIGTYVDPGVWSTASPLTSAWVNVGSPTGCTNWTPDPSAISSGLAFQQTATDCKQVQERTVQAREQNSVSLAYRDVGAPQTETQTQTVSSVRDAIGTSAVKTAVWMIKPGIRGDIVGYHWASTLGSLISEPSYTLGSAYFGTGNWIWVSVSGYNNQVNIPSIKVELLDASNNVTRTLSGATTLVQSYVMGIQFTADDLAAAKAAKGMRLTLQLKL